MDWVWVLIVAVRAGSADPGDRWAATLAELDRARSQAFARGDPARLDEAYVHDSRARRADAATIVDYRRRGARVVGAHMRVLSCRELDLEASRVHLDVVDRLAPAHVVWADGSRTALPRDEPSRRVVTLERTPEGWRVGEVSPGRPSRR